MRCDRPYCNKELADNWPHLFCQQCLEQYGVTCPSCGALVLPERINDAPALDCLLCRPKAPKPIDPFDEGWQARTDGKAVNDNPYPDLPAGHKDHWKQMDWDRGWNQRDDLLPSN